MFTPASGFEVSLMTIDSWVNSGSTPVLATFTLFNNNQLVSTTPFAASPEVLGVPHTVTAFGNSYFSGPLRLHVTPESSRAISFDNVTLDVRQVVVSGAVPEPATWLLMILGFGLIGGSMRRRRDPSVRLA